MPDAPRSDFRGWFATIAIGVVAGLIGGVALWLAFSGPRSAGPGKPSRALMNTNSEVEAIGVYRWPFSEADVGALSESLYGRRGRDELGRAREQLEGLVVIELWAPSAGRLHLDQLSQTPPSARDRNEQAPYDERWWSADGSRCLRSAPPTDDGPARVTFFLHFYERGTPLYDSDGKQIALPEMAMLPPRLASTIKYEAP